MPFLEPEEYQELSSRTFWTKEELHYMEMAKMKHQDTGVAFIKIGADKPVQTKIDHVKAVHYNARFSPKRIAAFEQKVIAGNEHCYIPVRDARHEYEIRQEEIFGEPLRFDEKPLTLIAEEIPTEPTSEPSPPVENPFYD